jgi:RimJ/RimL family protein N-acetyltransferase
VSFFEPVVLEPVVLEGEYVRLVPLEPAHVDALWAVAQDPEIWRFMPLRVTSRDELAFMVEYVRAVGQGFATVLRASGAPIGSTAFLAADPGNRRVEIGATWVTPAHQRSPVNTEAKLLQLTHAFEVLECARVELKTDARNERSRAAIGRLGASEEGTLRKHMLMPDGVWRDTVYFSILDTEWPDVKRRLQERLAR